MQFQQKLSFILDLFRYALRFKFRKKTALSTAERKKVLVIRLDRIGDFALYLPFAATLRHKYPAATHHITLLGRGLWMPLAQRHLDFDCFLEMEPEKFQSDSVYRRTLLRKIENQHYDIVLQPRFHRELLQEDLIVMAAAAPESIAFSATRLHIRKRYLRPWKLPYTTLLDSASLIQAHELTKNHRFIEHIEANSDTLPNPWRNRPPLPARLKELADCVLILPGGSTSGWSWPTQNFGTLAALATESGRTVAIAGIAAERPAADEVINAARCPAINLTGQLNMEEFASVIANASLVIGNDTGGIHLAAMSGVPTLVLVGQRLPGIFYPYPPGEGEITGVKPPVVVEKAVHCAGCYWRCRYQNTPDAYHCLRTIPLEAAKIEFEKLLNEISKGF